MMSRIIAFRCTVWYKSGALSRLFTLTRVPLKQHLAYRHSQSNKGFSKLHSRAVNERALKEQLDVMKQSVADLESADIFGSLSADCDIDEEFRDLIEADQEVHAPERGRRTSVSSGLSDKADERSRTRGSFSNREMVADVNQKSEAKGLYRSRQPVSKPMQHEHRITVPVEKSNKTNEHLEIYNKFSAKKSLPDIHPHRKDWSEKFGSLSDDVDKFLDKYVLEETRYI